MGMRWRSVMSPLRTGCSPTWKATSSTASMANIVFLLSRGIPGPLSPFLLAVRAASAVTPVDPKPPAPRGRLVELGNLAPDRPGVPRHDQLCNSHAAGDAERLLAQIDQDHAHFAAIVGVDGARRVGHGDAVLGGQPGTRADLGLEARPAGQSKCRSARSAAPAAPARCPGRWRPAGRRRRRRPWRSREAADRGRAAGGRSRSRRSRRRSSALTPRPSAARGRPSCRAIALGQPHGDLVPWPASASPRRPRR